MYSLGGAIGAFSAGLLASAGLTLELNLGIAALILAIPIWIMRKEILSIPHEQSAAPVFVIPFGPLIPLAVMTFFVLMAELAILDWSPIYLKNDLNSNALIAALGFAGFSLTMAIGRFYGDGIIPVFGATKIFTTGLLWGISGLAMVALLPYSLVAVLGFILAGIGLSCTVPILFSAAARIEGIDMSTGIAAVAGAGILGIFIGRPLMGMVAQYANLNASFGMIAIFLLVIWFYARRRNI